MSTSTLFTTLIVVAIVIYGISRQISEKEVKRFAFLIFPVICLYQAYTLLPKNIIPKEDLIQCLIAVIIGLIASTIQAFYTKVYYKEDHKLYMRGGIITLSVWIASLVLRLVIKVSFEGVDSLLVSEGPEWVTFVGMAVTFACRSFILHLKYPEVKQYLAKEKGEGRQSQLESGRRNRRSRRRSNRR